MIVNPLIEGCPVPVAINPQLEELVTSREQE